MSQIDVLMGNYTTEAAALADPALASFVRNGAWDLSRVFPRVQIWQPANDTTATVTRPQGQSIAVPMRQFESGYALIASYAEPSIAPGSVDPSAASLAPFKASTNCLLIADRDAAAASDPGFIYYAAPSISAALAGYRLQPTPLGANYPFGNP